MGYAGEPDPVYIKKSCPYCGEPFSQNSFADFRLSIHEAAVEGKLAEHIRYCKASPKAIADRESQERDREAQDRERWDRRDREAQERDRRREAERATGSSSNDSSSGNEWFWGIVLVMGALQIIADWFKSLHWFWQVLIVLTTLTLVLAALANHFGWGDDE